MLAPTAGFERATVAWRHYRHCLLCEHRCGCDRTAGEGSRCGASDRARVFRHRVEYGEELELVPSHLFYLSGCNLRCVFCIGGSNATDPRRGRLLTADFLSRAVSWGRHQGARNIQWVGGEPTIHVPAILEVMARSGDLPPVVWKSNLYATDESLRLLEGIVDVYVADFKFGNDACAKRICGAEEYLKTVTRNLRIVAVQGDLIIRHLLLPGHFDCCYRPMVDWIAEEMPRAKLSIRGGYLPCGKARSFGELARPLERGDLRRAQNLAADRRLNVIT